MSHPLTDPSCGGSSTVPWGRFTDFGALSDTGPGSFDYSVEGDQFRPFGPLYNFGPDNFLQRPDERYTAGMFGRYQINEHAEVFTEFNFMDNRSNAQIAYLMVLSTTKHLYVYRQSRPSICRAE